MSHLCLARGHNHPAGLLPLVILSLFFLLPAWPPGIQAAGLDRQEEQQAARLAAPVPWGKPRVARQAHPLGLQTVSIEKQEGKHESGLRMVRVYQYDYDRHAARLLVLDLTRNELVRTATIESVHLPLNLAEIQLARQLLAQDTPLVAELRAQQMARGQAPFASLDELDVKASIHEPMDPGDVCAMDRCALLSLFDHTRTVFATEPVVNLTRLSVDRLHPR